MPPLESVDRFSEGLVSQAVISTLQVDNSAALDIKNVEYHPRGAISRRQGYLSYTMSSTPITGVMKIFPWADSNGTETTLVYTTTSSGSLSADCYSLVLSGTPLSTAITAVASKLMSAELYANRTVWWNPNMSADEVHVASYAGSAIAVYGGSGPPLVVSGANISAVPGTSFYLSGAKHIAAWGNYLFLGNMLEAGSAVGGARNQSTIQWNLGLGSVWNGLTSWPASYYIDLDPDDGDEITGMQLLKEFLVVFKRNKIFLVWYTGDASLFGYRRQVVDVGCIAGNTIVAKGDYLYFQGVNGFYRFDGESATEISTKIKDIVVDDTSHTITSTHSAVVHEPHRQVWFSVNYTPYDAASESEDSIRRANAIFVFDYELKNWTIYDIKASAMANCRIDVSTGLDDLLLGHFIQTDATRKGCISQFGAYTTTPFTSDIYDSPITSYWISKWFDAKDQTRNKRLLRTVIIADQEGVQTDNYSLFYEFRENWKATRWSKIDDTTMSGTIYLTGSSTTLSGETVSTLRTGNPMEIRIDMSRTLRSWQLKLSNVSANNPWTVHRIVFDGVPKGRQPVV